MLLLTYASPTTEIVLRVIFNNIKDIETRTKKIVRVSLSKFVNSFMNIAYLFVSKISFLVIIKITGANEATPIMSNKPEKIFIKNKNIRFLLFFIFKTDTSLKKEFNI